MQKKILFLSLAILLIILIAVFFVFSNKKNITCNPYSNISTTVNTGDTKGCDCLADAEQKKLCEGNISAAVSLTDAVKQSDLSACDTILNLQMKESCQKIVQGKIDFANKNNSLSATSSQNQ